MAVTSPIHFITGLPCSGKSTLARGLAAALEGRAIVVGDLVRAARAASPVVAAQTAVAFGGAEEYDSGWLASLLGPVLARAQGPFVIDGAAPMDRVFARLGLSPESALVVCSSDATRRMRFRARRSTGARCDDDAELFAARTRFHLATLARTVQAIAPAARTFELDGDGEPRDLLSEALAAVALARHRARAPSVRDHSPRGREAAGELAALYEAALAGGDVRRLAGEREHAAGEGPLLLFKPGHALTEKLVCQVLGAFARAGYRAGAAAAWGGEVIAASAIVPAHLGLHHQVARYGDVSGRVSPAGRPGYELVRAGTSVAALDAWWHETPVPVRLAPCVWEKHGGSSETILNGHVPALERETILNGHVPALEQRWSRHDTAALAVELRAGRPALPWPALRSEVLGASDPRLAHPSSVRHMAFRGRLATREPVTLSANLAHLSAGPGDAARERRLWLAPEDTGRGARRLDPSRGGRPRDAGPGGQPAS